MRPICLVLFAGLMALAACSTGGLNRGDGVYAPGIAGPDRSDGLEVGHRLMAAGEYELALDAYTRAVSQRGLDIDTLSALGSVNLKLGRLGQAETLLRKAVDEDENFPAAWNNLGVVLMEKGEIGEAAECFRRAYATDSGNSDAIRDNLRLALAKLENPDYDLSQENENFDLVYRGNGDFVLLSTQ